MDNKTLKSDKSTDNVTPKSPSDIILTPSSKNTNTLDKECIAVFKRTAQLVEQVSLLATLSNDVEMEHVKASLAAVTKTIEDSESAMSSLAQKHQQQQQLKVTHVPAPPKKD